MVTLLSYEQRSRTCISEFCSATAVGYRVERYKSEYPSAAIDRKSTVFILVYFGVAGELVHHQYSKCATT